MIGHYGEAKLNSMRDKNGRFIKGNSGYWLGKKRLHMTDEKHPLWKGDSFGYYAWHNWAKKKVGKANRCENKSCVYPRKNARGKVMQNPWGYHLSSISGSYSRDIKDIQMLCISCHSNYDRKNHWGTISELFEKDRTGSPSMRKE